MIKNFGLKVVNEEWKELHNGDLWSTSPPTTIQGRMAWTYTWNWRSDKFMSNFGHFHLFFNLLYKDNILYISDNFGTV